MGTEALYGIIAVLVFLLLVVSLVASMATSRAAKYEAASDAHRAFYRAARWLATYNFARLSALSDVMAKALVMDLRTVQLRIDEQLEKLPYYGCAGQTVPTAKVPVALKDDIAAYNAMVLSARYITAFAGTVRAAGQLEVERNLRTALFIMTRAEPEATLEDVHCATGVPLPHVRVVALALRSRAEWDLHRLGTAEEQDPDPESVLPSIY